MDNIKESIQERKNIFDKSGDAHYDNISAFIKSMRGSSPDGALFYLARALNGGEDPMFLARRIMICASEDVGMADSNALLLAVSAMYAVQNMGIPEGLIPLSHAIIYACEAEKSNSVIVAMNAAKQDAEMVRDDCVPNHLKNHPTINGPKTKYKYPHDYENHYVKQDYLPKDLVGRKYYVFGNNKTEQAAKAYFDFITSAAKK